MAGGAVYYGCSSLGTACNQLVAARISVPTAAGSQLQAQFEANIASGYGFDIATAPASISFAPGAYAGSGHGIPGLAAVNYTLVVYDGLGSPVRGATDLVVRLRLCPALTLGGTSLSCSDDADSLLPVMFFTVEPSTGLCQVQSQEAMVCAVGFAAVEVQFSLAETSSDPGGLVPLTSRIYCLPCQPGQSKWVRAGYDGKAASWECRDCRAGQYVLDSNNPAYNCEDCPAGAVCSQSGLVGIVAGSTWLPDNTTGQYRLVSCPPGYQITNVDSITGLFSALAQACSLCPTSYFCGGGAASGTKCPAGTFSLAGSNSSDACRVAYFVQVVKSNDSI